MSLTNDGFAREGCMCDACIIARTREKIAHRAIDEQSNAYIQRRGGSLENPSVEQALKERDKR